MFHYQQLADDLGRVDRPPEGAPLGPICESEGSENKLTAACAAYSGAIHDDGWIE